MNNFDHASGFWCGFLDDFMDQINENEGEPKKWKSVNIYRQKKVQIGLNLTKYM